MTQLIESLDFGPRLDISVRSIAGIQRDAVDENQDNFVLIDSTGLAVFLHEQEEQSIQLPNWPSGHVRVAVMDGIGGHGQGRQVAEAVAAALVQLAPCSQLDTLCRQLDALHGAIQQKFTVEAGKPPGTTLLLIEIPPNADPMLYHVGDSRLYEIGAEQATILTVDHVPATGFAMSGLLSEQQWWQQVHAEDRSQISQAFVLGNMLHNPYVLASELMALTPDNLPPFLQHMADRRALTVKPEALYLLSTDGMWACSNPKPWIASWPALFDKPDRRIDYLLDDLFTELIVAPPDNLTVDNVTAIAIRFKPPCQQRATLDGIAA
jgi:serine/threonine protein phosphatase PrpC